jgi:hypothetical protein
MRFIRPQPSALLRMPPWGCPRGARQASLAHRHGGARHACNPARPSTCCGPASTAPRGRAGRAWHCRPAAGRHRAGRGLATGRSLRWQRADARPAAACAAAGRCGAAGPEPARHLAATRPALAAAVLAQRLSGRRHRRRPQRPPAAPPRHAATAPALRADAPIPSRRWPTPACASPTTCWPRRRARGRHLGRALQRAVCTVDGPHCVPTCSRCTGPTCRACRAAWRASWPSCSRCCLTCRAWVSTSSRWPNAWPASRLLRALGRVQRAADWLFRVCWPSWRCSC